MKNKTLRRLAAAAMLYLWGTQVSAQQLIECRPSSKGAEALASIWPQPYVSGRSVCFNVESWPDYTGGNCVSSGGSVSWTGTVIVTMDGESAGRDFTRFRVVSPAISDALIAYKIEWTRGGAWQTMQDVSINRLTGSAVSYFVTMHGGDSFKCHARRRAL